MNCRAAGPWIQQILAVKAIILGVGMSGAAHGSQSPLRMVAWAAAIILLLLSTWYGIALPLVSLSFGLMVPGVAALIAGIAIIVMLRRTAANRTAPRSTVPR